MTVTRTRRFRITVFTTADRDLAWYGTASTAPEMEQLVTDLRKRFPTPHYRIEVES